MHNPKGGTITKKAAPAATTASLLRFTTHAYSPKRLAPPRMWSDERGGVGKRVWCKALGEFACAVEPVKGVVVVMGPAFIVVVPPVGGCARHRVTPVWHPAALASVSCGVVLVQVQVRDRVHVSGLIEAEVARGLGKVGCFGVLLGAWVP